MTQGSTPKKTHVQFSPQYAKPCPGKLLIGGNWVEAASGKSFETRNPATGQTLTHVAEAEEEDVDRAVRCARAAFDSEIWSGMAAADRSRILWKIGDLIDHHLEELAELECLDVGKPISECRSIDVPLSAEIFHYYAGWCTKIHGETIPVRGHYLNYTLRQPVGVVGQIIPWNFPLLMAAFKVAPALAAGNTLVLKPAEQTPLTALRLGELCQEAGLPAGVVNIVTGFGPAAGAPLVKHPLVDKIAFTGDYHTGQEIMKNAANGLKRLSLELGGKSPNIVFPDADLEAARRGALFGIYLSQGQVCSAGSRLFVHASIHDTLVDTLVCDAENLKQGNPLDPATQMGAQISEEHLQKILSYVEYGQADGAHLRTGGQRTTYRDCAGHFINPTIFDSVNNDMRIAREEIFGPVLSVIRFDNLDQVIRLANDTPYGLAAGIWTRDVKKAHYVAHKVRAGTVWINAYNLVDPAAPWGGFKMSGFGRELGKHALELYTEVKSVWVALN